MCVTNVSSPHTSLQMTPLLLTSFLTNQSEKIKTIKSSQDKSGATDSLPKERSQLELEENMSS